MNHLALLITAALLFAPGLDGGTNRPAGGTGQNRPAPIDSGTARSDGSPKLVVIVVVDQMRADYLDRYGANLKQGLRRLLRDGARFTNAAYPYLNTVTCPGHTTIGTGSFPYRHGMILNAWYDPATRASPYCTDDTTVKDISYNGLPPATGDSAARMLMPALGEQIHARGGRSVAMSLKPRSAITLAGRKADAVIWFDDRGGWSTSTAFATAPVPFLQKFIDANPVAADYNKTWTRTLDASAYQYDDDGVNEGTPNGWTRTFPHALGTPGGKPDATFYGRWQRSPFADEYLGRMAEATIDALNLGRGKTLDFLAVSFSSLDIVGHTFGPKSHEVQDMLVRLDVTIGRLLEHLDKAVGPGNYVLGFSADHGVADVPEQSGRGGRQPTAQIRNELTKVLAPALGAGQHVLSVDYTDIYLSSAARQRLQMDHKLMAAATEALTKLPSIERVLRGTELATAAARSSSDPVIRAAALSYKPGRSGDLVVVPKEGWLLSNNVTTHGTNRWYDQQVPVILFGASIKPGEYRQATTPADIVPTLAAIARVPIKRGDGRVLSEAIVSPATR
jgi:predicted AlkP superfamily pyrophosphatase or phosphodiesterase